MALRIDLDASEYGRLVNGNDRLQRENAALLAALTDAIRTWRFNDYQHPTHSWHDREDWFERHEIAREIRKKAPHA